MRGSEGELAVLLTPARLSSYERATTSPRRALRLYEWNMRASSSALELTGIVEIVARNAIDRELSAWSDSRYRSGSWFDHVPLDRQGSVDLAKARDRATRRGGEEVHGRVLAELSFGFWRYLVETRYLTALWTPVLHRAFASGPSDILTRQRQVRTRLQQLHFLRNRAAHHEPIHQRDLRRDHDYAIELLGWISPVAAEWASATTSLPALLDGRPSP